MNGMPGINEKIAGILIGIFKDYDRILTEQEVEDIRRYTDRKAKNRYEIGSPPYYRLLEDELRSYVFRTRLTELTCGGISN